MSDQTPDARAADRLVGLALAHGERFFGGGNRPIHLSDPDTVWMVIQGSVDVFATRPRDDGVPIDFKHLLRAESGQLLFSAADDTRESLLVAKGLPESELRRVPFSILASTGIEDEIVEQVNAWISGISQSIVRDVTYRPRVGHQLALGRAELIAGGTTLSAQNGLLWASSEEGSLDYLSTDELDPHGSGLVPVTTASWVTQRRTAPVNVTCSRALQQDGRLLAALAEFNRLALRADRLNRALLLADVSNFRNASARYRQRSEEQARRNLFSVVGGDLPPTEDGSSVLLHALERIGRHEDIRFRAPPRDQRDASSDGETDLEAILNASGVRARRIVLRNQHRWWLGDSGAMLASRRDDGSPVALIPGTAGRYLMFTPHSQRAVSVNAQHANALEPTAYFFYCPLPDDCTTDVSRLLRVAFNRAWGDLARLIGAGILSGLAMLAPAMMLGIFVSQALPAGDFRTLGLVTLGLALVALIFALLQVLQGTALMRLEGRAAARIEAALWDRILVLPSSFFRRFTVGDLGTRVMGFQMLRDQVSGVVARAMLSLIFLLPTFVLLFLYDTVLGWLCLSLGAISLGVTLWLGLRQMPLQRRLAATSRQLTGVLLQLIGGVGKLRVTGAEASAFAMWAGSYREQKRIEMQLGTLNEHLIAFTAAAPLFAMAALFSVGLNRSEEGLTVGGFLVIYAAFMVFFNAVAQFGLSFSAIAAILPVVEQAVPILTERPRGVSIGGSSPELQGELHMDHVTFRYAEDGPYILQDVSIHARPGEFVALVGESGAGKTTLLRLALGLESPLSGAVYYDGHDLERLNRRSVRSGVGMVVQNASLRPQTVLDNIIGAASDLTVEDAWRAARLALVDNDIAAMPMGMNTATDENSSTFSGGQAQRIMLAAALVRNPRVLLLDEATNWLDNETQARVMNEIDKLAVTRIVSAHRLSTIRRADRIYVLHGGRVIQQGTFDELMLSSNEVFREMVVRQVT